MKPENQPLVTIGLTYPLVLALAFYMGILPCLIISPILFAAACVLVFVKRSSRTVLILFTAALALLVNVLYTELVCTPVERLDGLTGRIEGIVTELSDSDGQSNFLVLDVKESDELLKPIKRIKVYLPTPPEMSLFDRVSLPVKLMRASDRGLVSSRDRLKSDGIFIIGQSVGTIEYLPPDGAVFQRFINNVRTWLIGGIEQSLPGEAGGVLAAASLGYKNNLPDRLRMSVQKLGVSHVLAVSGLHVSIIMGLILGLFTKRKRLGFIVTISCLLLYMLFAGMSLSVTRAVVMSVCYLLARLLGRDALPLASLGLAGLIITLINPFAAADAGFMLSFCATAGIIMLTPRVTVIIKKFTPFVRGDKRPLTELLSVNSAATLSTLPLISVLFGRISLLSPLANLLIVPLVPPLILFGLVLSLVGRIPILSQIMGFVAGLYSAGFSSLCELLARVPYMNLPTAQVYLLIWLAALFAGIAVLYVINGGKRLIKWFVPVMLIPLAMSILLSGILDRSAARMTVYNPQKGIAVSYEDTQTTVVYDTDDIYSARAIAEQFYYADRTIDTLIVLSSGTKVNRGLSRILSLVTVKTVIIPNDDGTLARTVRENSNAKTAELASGTYGDIEVRTDKTGTSVRLLSSGGGRDVLICTRGYDAVGIEKNPYLLVCDGYGLNLPVPAAAVFAGKRVPDRLVREQETAGAVIIGYTDEDRIELVLKEGAAAFVR